MPPTSLIFDIFKYAVAPLETVASWLFGISEESTEQIVDTKDTPPDPTTVNPEPVDILPTTPQSIIDLHLDNPNMADLNPTTTMLDSIPFILSNQIIMSTTNFNRNLDNTKRQLLSIKKLLESDAYNYDFSNDKRLMRSSSLNSL